MMIERDIYSTPDINDQRASIHIYISPNKTINNTRTDIQYTLFIDAVSLNDSMFRIKIENVQKINLENACMLILNTLHMYWMPCYFCKDFIEYDDDIISSDVVPEFSSTLFNNLIDKLDLDALHRRETCFDFKWLKGEILVLDDGTLSFKWTRPMLHIYDDGNTNDVIQFDTDFELSIEYNRQHTEIAPIGFKFPCL